MDPSPSTADALARLAALESDFQRMLEVEKLEALAEFAAGAGHEINNPLTVISGRAQLLLRDETDAERRRALALICAQAMRVHEMIADMMLFARPPRPELQRVELVGLLDALMADFLPRCESQATALCRTGEPGPVCVEADPVQLRVALGAIVQNAIESLDGGGRIELRLEKGDSPRLPERPEAVEKGDSPHLPERPEGCCAQMGTVPFFHHVRIRVCDDGPGLRPEERRHVFDPFYSARQAGRGLGLGLSKAWRIVANHGGRIDVESQPGRGATFTVVLPQGRQVGESQPFV
jgi:signal transduction histidine kinase